MLREKLLGNSSPVALSRIALGTAVINATTATSIRATANDVRKAILRPVDTVLSFQELSSLLLLTVLQAIDSSKSHTSNGVSRLSTNVPKNHLMPSLLSSECIGTSGIAALTSHDTMITATCNSSNTTATIPNSLFFIGLKVVNIEYSQFQSSHNEARGIDSHATVATGKEFLHKLVLPLLKAFHTERHTPEVGYLLLGVA